MKDNISSNQLLIQSSKMKRTASNGQVPVYYLGIAYVGSKDFFKSDNLKKEFPVSTLKDANVSKEDMKNFHHRNFLSSFIDFLDTKFPTEEGSICLDEGRTAEEGTSPNKAFFHYANNEFGRGEYFELFHGWNLR